MEVQFRDVDPFNCWIWLRTPEPLSQGERGYVETAFDSWFFLGKLGGFNAENLQAHEEGVDLSWMAYDGDGAERAMPALMHNMGELELKGCWARCWVDLGTSDGAERAMPALMHNMGELELKGCWARCWVDLGTSDALALDVLINTLRQLNNDVLEIEQLLIGGINEDWPIDDQPEAMFAGLDALAEAELDDDRDDDNDDMDHGDEDPISFTRTGA